MSEEDSLSPSQILSILHPKELYEASIETSPILNGKILAIVIEKMLRRNEWSMSELIRRTTIARTIVYKWKNGKPLSDKKFERAMRELVLANLSE